MTDPLATYTHVAPVDVPASAFDMQGHLNNAGVIKLFNNMRIGYVVAASRERWQEPLQPERNTVVVLELFARFVSQGMPGEDYDGGTRIVARSNKAWCYDQLIVERKTRRLLARCRVVEVVVSNETQRSIPIPEAFWALVERIEDRTIPVGTLPVPRIDWETL